VNVKPFYPRQGKNVGIRTSTKPLSIVARRPLSELGLGARHRVSEAIRKLARSASFEVAHFDRICPEGAKQYSPGQSEVALRHERRPGKQKAQQKQALKGRNKNLLEILCRPFRAWFFC
jgi:hypothetical protein